MDTIQSWSENNRMRINAKKTKEMLISFQKLQKDIPPVIVDGQVLERVDCVTLLGVKINNKLTWDEHVEHIVKKAQKRLFSLTLLRRSKVAPKDIVNIYCAKIRPVLEYASPVWHGGLTDEQSCAIEYIQERALRIAHPGMEYKDALSEAGIPLLSERRHIQCKALFERMQDPQDKLHRILPAERENMRNTRHHKKFPLPRVYTERYKGSFLPYALFNCQ